MTTPALDVRKEVRELIQTQIDTFAQPSGLTESELREYLRRSERLKFLWEELDRIATRSVLEQRFG